MNTFTKAPTRMKVTGAVLAMAALAAVLLAVMMSAGPTMAQGELEPDIPSNAEEYADFGALPCSEE